MRKILQIAAILSALLLCSAAPNANLPPDGTKKVKEENKAKVIYFFSKYCEYCNAMDHDVLSDRGIRGMLERDVVYLRIDADKNPETAKKHGIWGYPTTLLTESTGRTIARIPGYISKKEFKKIMQYLKEKRYKTTRLGDFLNTEKTK
jgi:thioredoxin-related protein